MDAYVPRAFHVDEVKRLEVRIKQLEIGHDEWRTHARRAKAEVERLRATVTHLEKVNDELNEDAIALGRENERLRAANFEALEELEKRGARIEAALAKCAEHRAKAVTNGDDVAMWNADETVKALKGEKPFGLSENVRMGGEKP